jgi:hypothetical protein
MSYNNPPLPGKVINKHVLSDKKFAWFPKRCRNHGFIWLKVYYCVRHDNLYSSEYRSVENFYNLTEDDYIIRKLAGTL